MAPGAVAARSRTGDGLDAGRDTACERASHCEQVAGATRRMLAPGTPRLWRVYHHQGYRPRVRGIRAAAESEKRFDYVSFRSLDCLERRVSKR
jgi:hypothetical protein